MSDERPRFYERYLKKVPQQPRSRSVVDAILSAAVERITRTSDDVSVQEVATRAGVSIGSLYDYFRDRDSLLTAAMGKLAQNNLEAFERVLGRTAPMPLREAIEAIVDFALETYAKDTATTRLVMRTTMRFGLMPTLAASQTVFARTLADALRARTDVADVDLDSAAWVVTQSLMGLIGTMVWEEKPSDRRPSRDAFVAMTFAYLARGVAIT